MATAGAWETEWRLTRPLRSKLRTGTLALPLHSMCQSKSQDPPHFRRNDRKKGVDIGRSLIETLMAVNGHTLVFVFVCVYVF